MRQMEKGAIWNCQSSCTYCVLHVLQEDWVQRERKKKKKKNMNDTRLPFENLQYPHNLAHPENLFLNVPRTYVG